MFESNNVKKRLWHLLQGATVRNLKLRSMITTTMKVMKYISFLNPKNNQNVPTVPLFGKNSIPMKTCRNAEAKRQESMQGGYLKTKICVMYVGNPISYTGAIIVTSAPVKRTRNRPGGQSRSPLGFLNLEELNRCSSSLEIPTGITIR